MLTPQMNCSPHFHRGYSFYSVGSTSSICHALQCERWSNGPDTARAPVPPLSGHATLAQSLNFCDHFPCLINGGNDAIYLFYFNKHI